MLLATIQRGGWALALFFTFSAFSQNTRTISGVVTSVDEAGPLEGVAVSVKGKKIQSGSQPDGVYYISVNPDDSVLVFSYEGFATEEVKLSSAREYNVALKRRHTVVAPFPQGGWRGVFIREGVEIPFNFEISGEKAWLLNAEERFEAGAARLVGDSLFIALDQFDNELAFAVNGTHAEGVLRKQEGQNVLSSVKADWGRTDRFVAGAPPAKDISGKYEVVFRNSDGSETKTVGLFRQSGNSLKAVFLRTTGDSRFLEGVVSGNQLFLSSFIGSGPSYYTGAINTDGSISGIIPGARGGQAFSAIKNDNAALPDPYSLTYLKPGYTSFDFAFPDLDGNIVSLKDPAFKNKVVIVTITGTWCPNCIDEAAFLSSWYEANKSRGVEAVAIHYERQLDPAFLNKAIGRFRKQHNIKYREVIGGIADKKKVAESLPALNSFLAFPTILFIDKKGNVAKIYTGFTGPATGSYYEQFKKEFDAEVNKLLKQ